MDVEKQSLSGLQFLATAYVYDICNGLNPCQVRSDHTVIRQHLATCLKKCQFSRFFSLPGEQKSTNIKSSKTVDLASTVPAACLSSMAKCLCHIWYH